MRRRELEQRRASLGEIMGIMNAMKNLALLETRKLGRYLATQHRAVESLEGAAGDFQAMYPALFTAPAYRGTVYVLVGSQRGFCGDYNEAVIRALPQPVPHAGVADTVLLPVGYRVARRLDGDPRAAPALEGAGMVEEIEKVLVGVVAALREVQRERGPLRPVVVHHRAGVDRVDVTPLDPFERSGSRRQSVGPAPRLYLAPEVFLAGFLEHYLFARLHEIFYTALMAENERRIRHMEGAVREIRKERGQLRLRRNAMRQEEITEEIEVILLSAQAMTLDRLSM